MKTFLKFTFLLLLSSILFFSCDSVVYKKSVPQNKTSLNVFPLHYQGTYVNYASDSLFIGSTSFYYKKKPAKDGKDNSKRGVIGDNLVIKYFKDGVFGSYKPYKTASYWNGRYVELKNNQLLVYKITDIESVKNIVYDYSYNNKSKLYTISPTDQELNKLYENNKFVKVLLFNKISNSSNTNTKKTINNTALKTGCVYGDCKDGYGVYSYNNGDMYFGFFKNYKRHGFGEYKWVNDSDYYIGNWNNNNRSGYGKHYWKNKKSLYVGEWKNHLISGYGYKINSDLTTDRGLWQAGRMVSKYNFFFNGKYNERKTLGCIRGDCQNGYGKFAWNNGSVFEGFFINGKLLLGEIKYKNGDRYEGEFNTNGYREGTGLYTYSNGNTYRGQWLNGKKHGLGIFKYKNGKRYAENYNNGKLITTKLTKY